MQQTTASSRGRLIAAAIALVALTSGGTLVSRRYFMPSATAEATGTLVVNTSPAGMEVLVDGRHRGATPFEAALNPGRHVLEIVSGDTRRTIPLTIVAGGQVEQLIELPQAAPLRGQLVVRTDPSGAAVTVDGQPRGTSPLTLEDLAPGMHTVTLESQLGPVTQRVKIEGGMMASLVVPLTASPGAPISGWIAIAAPVDVQVFENQRLLGSSRSDRIMLSVGRHDLEIVNEALDYRAARTIQVAPGQVSPIKLDWPKGSMALNAQPWAEVWIDGERIGETPIGNVALPIGPHEVVFRHPELGERRYNTTVTVSTVARLSVDLRKK